jgi:hypothetical protein
VRRGVLAGTAALLLAAAASAGDAPSADAIRKAAHEVLSRPEFRRGTTKPASLLEELWEWWSSLLGDLHAQHPYLFFAAIGALTLLLIALIIHIAWTLRAARQAAWQGLPDADLEAAIRRGDPAAFRARAVAHADAGRFENAVRDLYAALLLTFDRRGALQYAPHKALLDYRIEAARDAHVVGTLDAFASVYHPGSFGRRPPDRAHFDALLAELDRVAERAA